MTAPVITLGAANAPSVIAGSALTSSTDGVSALAGPYRYSRADVAIAGPTFPLSLMADPVGDPGSEIPWTFRVEFFTDAPEIEVLFRGVNAPCDIRVNGVLCHVDPISTGPSDGNFYLLHVDFGSSLPRDISIDTSGDFGGVQQDPAYTLAAPLTPAPSERVIVMGDSFTEGEGAAARWRGFPLRLGEIMGWRDVWASGRGGTGYLAAGPYVPLGARVAADVIAHSPDVVVIAAGIADVAEDPDDVGAAAAALYAEILDALPDVTLYVVSPWWPGTPVLPAALAVGAAIESAAVAAGATYIDALTEPWITGTGDEAAPAADGGNADIYISADGTHPTQAGHDYLGGRLADTILSPVEAVETVIAWPDLDELKQLLDITSDDWDGVATHTHLTRLLSAAIDRVKAEIGGTPAGYDVLYAAPTEGHAQAALRMAELLATRPDVSPSIRQDPTLRRLLYGQRHRFGVA